MKKGVTALAALCLLLTGCNATVKTEKELDCGQVISAYEANGYEVFHKETTTEEWGDYVCYVKATDPDTQEYIFFHFFESHEKAATYAESRRYNVLIWLFSVIYGDPAWLITKVYNDIEIEYDHAYLYEPFEELISAETNGNSSVEKSSSWDENESSTHICQPVPFEKEPTCQEEGYCMIACTDCLEEFEQFRVIYPKVACAYGEDGRCVWCQSEVQACEKCQAVEFSYRESYGMYLCDECYKTFSENGLEACCICGSYRCKGHE